MDAVASMTAAMDAAANTTTAAASTTDLMAATDAQTAVEAADTTDECTYDSFFSNYAAADDDNSDSDSDSDDESAGLRVHLENFKDNEHITFPLVLIEGFFFRPRSSPRIDTVQACIRGESAGNLIAWPVTRECDHFKVFVMLPRPGDYCIELIVRGDVVREIPIRYTRPITTRVVRFHYEKQAGDARGFDAPTGVDNSNAAALKRIQLGALLTQTCIAELFYNQGFPRATIALEFELDESSNCEMPLVHMLETPANSIPADAIFDALDEQNAVAEAAGLSLLHFVHVGSNYYDPATRRVANHCACMYNGAFLFSSATLHTWPSALSEITRCVLDTTQIDTSVLCTDGGVGDVCWANFATGLGVFMHFLFRHASPVRSSRGFFARGFDNVNRMLTVYEPTVGSYEPAFSTRSDGTLALNHGVVEPIATDLGGAYVEEHVLVLLLESCPFFMCANKTPQAVAAATAA